MNRPTGLVALLAATAGAAALVHRLARRSGATLAETRRRLPGDGLVPRPLWQSTRTITIAAPPAAVWPWIVQMGFPPHRAGWYTPHWLDELMWGERPRSADEIVPALQDLKVGDKVPDSADWSVYYTVDEVEPDSHLVLYSTRHVFPPLKSSSFSWAFVLRPVGDGATRLLVRARVDYAPAWAYPLVEAVVGLGDWVNVTAMLRNVRSRVERGRSDRT
jgi:hypothetical protein